jgi:hypothetical protein
VLIELDANRDDVSPQLDIPEEVLRELPHAAQRTERLDAPRLQLLGELKLFQMVRVHLDGIALSECSLRRIETEPERPADGEADLRKAVLIELDANRDDVSPQLDLLCRSTERLDAPRLQLLGELKLFQMVRVHLDGIAPERPADGEADLRKAVLIELDANRDDVSPQLDIPEEVLRELPHLPVFLVLSLSHHLRVFL